ncbi:MAG TPA: alpha/beta hydrolase [Myxococcota bacterium]|nr:alpha/beta hydrolase [Myxococcota bacterium]
MSWLFLAVSLWGAWFTYNALRPSWDSPRFAVVSFAAGWLTSELALHHILWQAVATAFFLYAGALAHWPGQLGLVITLASWAGLVLVQRQAHATDAVIESALVAALGPGYREQILPGLREKLVHHIDWARVWIPFPIRRNDVVVDVDIPFGREGGKHLELDVYRSAARPTGCPVLFQIHGGGWMIGDKREQALPLMNHMASAGWVCVTANYRLSPAATYPEHLIDCKRALAWIREHIHEYGGDPDLVVVTGGSAGGHLAALVALTQGDAEYQPGFEQVDTRVRGCVPFYGVYDFVNRSQTWRNDGLQGVLEERILKCSLEQSREAWDRASPVTHVSSDAPPFFVIHGDSDTLVPVPEAREFVKALREKSRAPVVYAELPGAQHAFEIFPSVRTIHTVNGVHRFLAWLESGWRRQREGLPRRDAA